MPTSLITAFSQHSHQLWSVQTMLDQGNRRRVFQCLPELILPPMVIDITNYDKEKESKAHLYPRLRLQHISRFKTWKKRYFLRQSTNRNDTLYCTSPIGIETVSHNWNCITRISFEVMKIQNMKTKLYHFSKYRNQNQA